MKLYHHVTSTHKWDANNFVFLLIFKCNYISAFIKINKAKKWHLTLLHDVKWKTKCFSALYHDKSGTFVLQGATDCHYNATRKGSIHIKCFFKVNERRNVSVKQQVLTHLSASCWLARSSPLVWRPASPSTDSWRSGTHRLGNTVTRTDGLVGSAAGGSEDGERKVLTLPQADLGMFFCCVFPLLSSSNSSARPQVLHKQQKVSIFTRTKQLKCRICKFCGEMATSRGYI